MALSFANTAGNLFNRLGRFGRLALLGRVFQGDLATYFAALLAQYDSSVASPLQGPVSGVPYLRDAAQEAALAYEASLVGNANLTVTEMMKADKPTAAGSVADALTEVAAQMVTAGASIKKCTVTATAAQVAGNSGDGVTVVSAKRGDGRDQELIIPEVSYLRCIADSQTGGAVLGQELFNYIGEVRSTSVWSADYPVGSGAQTAVRSIDAADPGVTGRVDGNVLVNGSFETWTVANVPDNWTIQVGAAGTEVLKSSTPNAYAGSFALQIAGSALNTAVYQEFNQTSGSPVVLRPSQSYAISFRAKMDVGPAAGVLTVELVDGTGAVINDDQGVANSFTVNLVALGVAYVAQTGVFRLPKLVPSVVRLRYRVSTALTVGRNLFIDHAAAGRLTSAYAGGPGVAQFSGAVKWVTNDAALVTTTNDFGGAANLATFQWFLDRLFGTRNLGVAGLLFPTNAAPTVPDTLITA